MFGIESNPAFDGGGIGSRDGLGGLDFQRQMALTDFQQSWSQLNLINTQRHVGRQKTFWVILRHRSGSEIPATTLLDCRKKIRLSENPFWYNLASKS